MELPEALLAEIAWRSDPATLLRLAATCKLLHGTLNEPQFLGRYRLSTRSRRRPIFVGAFVWQASETDDPSFVPSPAPGARALSSTIRSNLAQGWHGREPAMASRGGLVVLDDDDDGVHVWNPVTGRTWDFPSPAASGGKPLDLDILLDGDDGRFRLLFVTVATHGVGNERQRVLCAQTLSRDEGAWGPVVTTPDPGPSGGWCAVIDAAPLVLGATAHWLCCWSPTPDEQYSRCRFHVLSYDVDAAQAVALYVPPDCFRDVDRRPDLLLASSPDGEMSLLVATGLEIRVWTLRGSGKAELAHRVEVDAVAMTREMEWPPLRFGEVELVQFVEASGVLVVQVAGLGVFAMDLFQKAWTEELDKTPSSREVLKLTDDRHMHLRDINDVYVVPYEMDVFDLVPIPP